MRSFRLAAAFGLAVAIVGLGYANWQLEPPELPPKRSVPTTQQPQRVEPRQASAELPAIDQEGLREFPVFEPSRRRVVPPALTAAPVDASAHMQPTEERAEVPPPADPLPVFAGVVASATSRMALLKLPDQDAVALGVGDSAGPWRVLEIEPRQVRLEGRGGVAISLPLKFGGDSVDAGVPSPGPAVIAPTSPGAPSIPPWIIGPARDGTR